jgi:hypothetical protein
MSCSIVFGFVLLAAVILLLAALIIMLLWNAVMPPLFDVHQITYWQALLLFVLCRLLFGDHSVKVKK